MSWACAPLVATLHAITHNSEESHVRKYGTKFWFTLQNLWNLGRRFTRRTREMDFPILDIVKHTGTWEKSIVFGYSVNAAKVWYEIVLSSCPSEPPVFGTSQDHYFNHKASQTLSNVMQTNYLQNCPTYFPPWSVLLLYSSSIYIKTPYMPIYLCLCSSTWLPYLFVLFNFSLP